MEGSFETAKEQFNTWGKQNNPFFFFIPYDKNLPVFYYSLDKIPNTLFFDLGVGKQHTITKIPSLPPQIIFNTTPCPYNEYKRSFDIAQKHLHYGNSYLLNLTYATPVQTNLSLTQIFYYSQAPYKLLNLDTPKFVCFSPEIFIETHQGNIIARPMKGTISASIIQAEQKLLEDEKEQREHATIVDLLRNDLAQVATSIQVTKYRYLDSVKTQHGTILQTSSEITGKLPSNWESSLGQIVFSLLPAGSITGAPKEWTCRAIREAENYQRGYYTGIFGIYTHHELTTAVSIRYIEETSSGLVYKSGGGITTSSLCEKEYKELNEKIYVPFAR